MIFRLDALFVRRAASVALATSKSSGELIGSQNSDFMPNMG